MTVELSGATRCYGSPCTRATGYYQELSDHGTWLRGYHKGGLAYGATTGILATEHNITKCFFPDEAAPMVKSQDLSRLDALFSKAGQ
jgi:hypothetical protein